MQAGFVEVSSENPAAGLSSHKRKADIQKIETVADRTKKSKDEKDTAVEAPCASIPASLFSLPAPVLTSGK